jgi:lysophospholipase L1-like esterase
LDSLSIYIYPSFIYLFYFFRALFFFFFFEYRLIIACTENMTPDLVKSNTAPFVSAIRAAWGNTLPIVLVEPIDFTPSWLLGETSLNRTGLRLELNASYQAMIKAGDTALTYVPASLLQAAKDSQEEEITYEGVHPLDRGHTLIANAMVKVVEPLVLSSLEHQEKNTVSHKKISSSDKNWKTVDTLKTIVPGLNPFTEANNLQETINWTPATSLTILGRAFNDTPTPFNRLPSKAQGIVRDEVWDLSLNSAGVTVAFSTDSPYIWVNYTTASPMEPMVHFSASGVSGADLFAYDANTDSYRFVAPSQVVPDSMNLTAQFTPIGVNVTTIGKPIRWLLFLATYNTVTDLSIGISSNAQIQPDNPWTVAGKAPAPIVWYGTSILQGGVAQKVGNIETARVSLALKREIYNFGFSGNCKMELNVAQYLVTIPNPAAFILDCNWNMAGDEIRTGALAFVPYLRKTWPTIPIILAEGLPFGRNWATPDEASGQNASNFALATAYATLVANGDKNLAYVNSTSLFGADASIDSATAAGLHATDAGMHDMAKRFIELLQSILGTETM